MSRKSQEEIAREDELIRDAYLGVDFTSNEIFNPIANIPESCYSNPYIYLMWLMSRPEYFCLFVKHILNIELYPFQALIIKEMWDKKFPMLIGCRGLSKTFMLAIYVLLRMIFMPGRKIVITGAVFRQSKLVFEYCERIWHQAPILRDLANEGKGNGPFHGNDAWKFVIGDSVAFALPIGDGSTIRGYRANDIIVDEFASGNVEVFEHVIRGFAMVNSDPMNNSKRIASRKKAEELGRTLEIDDQEFYKSNQVILAGTAYYEFNHFYKYWKRYKGIISTKGDRRRLVEMGEEPDTEWDQHSIIRIPFELLPDGLMDKSIIASARGNLHISLYMMEVQACFSSDSNGFFKRALLEKCVSNHTIVLYGERDKEYVIGIDPASEEDNFCIVVLEISRNIRRVVYCWTSTKQGYKDELKSGKAKENDFYDYVCRKILDLVNNFNVVGIAIDSQGGGHAIVGRLHNPSVVRQDENPLWPIIDLEKPTEDDTAHGRHILELISFADSKWTSDANHGMRLDFESRALLFPKFDGLTFAEVDLSSLDELNKCDVTEEAVLEIEEMKNELSSIVMTQTPTGRDKWDTPDQKLPGTKKGKMRKDRYSSLLMANYLGKKHVQDKREIEYSYEGGVAKNFKPEDISGPAFIGTTAEGMLLAQQLNEMYS